VQRSQNAGLTKITNKAWAPLFSSGNQTLAGGGGEKNPQHHPDEEWHPKEQRQHFLRVLHKQFSSHGEGSEVALQLKISPLELIAKAGLIRMLATVLFFQGRNVVSKAWELPGLSWKSHIGSQVEIYLPVSNWEFLKRTLQ
jgi:hypothetical protein